jgi:hypothetical protein
VNAYDTGPESVPLAPAVIVNHDTELDAVHEQPASVVTFTVPVPAAATTEALVGATVKVQGTPVCVTVKVCPAIVSVPVRDDVDGLAATANVTAPLPLVFGPAPAVTEIQETLLVALHEQPTGMVTDTTRVLAAESTVVDVDDSTAVQGAPA